MTSSTEQLSHLTESAARTDTPITLAWYRDPRLWVAVTCTLVVKVAVIALWLTRWKDAGWVDHVNADVWTWMGFFRESKAGGIPYVDFGREYPVLAGGLYWLLAHAIDLESPRSVLLGHASLMASVDVLNAGLFYWLARAVNRRFALPVTLLLSLSLTGLVLGPMRFEGFLVTSLLVGYRLHKQGRPLAAAAVWSLGCAIKWFPLFLLAIQEARAFFADRQRWRWLKAGLIFAAIQLALNAPLLLASWLKNGSLDHWLYTYTYHTERQLSVDTVLGMAELWVGPIAAQKYAAHWSLALMLGVIALKPAYPLPYKLVLVTIAAVLLNRIYSPQFNLWFYPFLMLIVLQSARRRALLLLGLYVALDVLNMQAYPFSFTHALDEMGEFRPHGAALEGREWTTFWSVCIALRAAVLLALAAELWRGPQPVAITWARLQVALARARDWARSQAALVSLTAVLLVAQSLWTRAATYGMGKYSDEYFHVKQIRRFCRGRDDLIDGLTMIPGYHAVSAALGKLIDDCSMNALRTFNLGWGLAASLLAYWLLRSLQSQRPLARTMSFHFLPVLFPYHFFVFTDVVALVPTLLALYLLVQRRWTAAAAAACVGVVIRQPNVTVLLLIAGVAFIEQDAPGSARARLSSYLGRTWLCWLGLLAFAAFVIINGGVAMGDRDEHKLGFHLENVFFALFLLCVVSLPVSLETIWKKRDRVAAPVFLFALMAAYVLYMLTFRVSHAYNSDPAFLRNQLLAWAVQSPPSKSLFFIPIATGFAAVWLTPLARRWVWVLLPVALALLVPESLIEHRYTIVPIGLWMLLRRDASPVAESLTALTNAAISTAIMLLIWKGGAL